MKKKILSGILTAALLLGAAAVPGAYAANTDSSAIPITLTSSSSSTSSTDAKKIEVPLPTVDVITRVADVQVRGNQCSIEDAVKNASALPDANKLDYTGTTLVISAAEDIPAIKDASGKTVVPAAANGSIVQTVVLQKGDDPTAVKIKNLASGYAYTVTMTVPPQQQEIALLSSTYTFTAGDTDTLQLSTDADASSVQPAFSEGNNLWIASSSASSEESALSTTESASSDAPSSQDDVSYANVQTISQPLQEDESTASSSSASSNAIDQKAVSQSVDTTAAFSYSWNTLAAAKHPAALSLSNEKELAIYTASNSSSQDKAGRTVVTPASTKVATFSYNGNGVKAKSTDSLSDGSYYIGRADTQQVLADTTAGSAKAGTAQTLSTKARIVSASALSSTSNSQVGALQIVNTMEGKSDGQLAGVQFKVTGAQSGGRRYDKTFTTDAHGKITIEKLPVGTYTAQPLSNAATAGYLIPEKKTLTVRASMMATINFQTEKAPASSTAPTSASTFSGNPAPGAVLTSSTSNMSSAGASSSGTGTPGAPAAPKTGQDSVAPVTAAIVLLGAGTACFVICRNRRNTQHEQEQKK